jgi:hypothetical protein
MTIRTIFGLGWSLLAGLAGGWLAAAPWVLGEQRPGDWTIATRNELGLGLGLVALAVVGVGVVVGQAVAALRAAGVVRSAQPGAARGRTPAAASSPEMERALIDLAHALARDLDSQRVPAPSGHQPAPDQPSVPGWRERP